MLGLHFLVEVLFRSWWSGGLIARAIIFVIVWATSFEVLLGAHPGGDDPHSLPVRIGAVGTLMLAWGVSGIPAYRRRHGRRKPWHRDFYLSYQRPR